MHNAVGTNWFWQCIVVIIWSLHMQCIWRHSMPCIIMKLPSTRYHFFGACKTLLTTIVVQYIYKCRKQESWRSNQYVSMITFTFLRCTIGTQGLRIFLHFFRFSGCILPFFLPWLKSSFLSFFFLIISPISNNCMSFVRGWWGNPVLSGFLLPQCLSIIQNGCLLRSLFATISVRFG